MLQAQMPIAASAKCVRNLQIALDIDFIQYLNTGISQTSVFGRMYPFITVIA